MPRLARKRAKYLHGNNPFINLELYPASQGLTGLVEDREACHPGEHADLANKVYSSCESEKDSLTQECS